MNRLFLTLLFIASSLGAIAQYQYIPMPLSEGQWRYRMMWDYQNSSTLLDYMLLGSNDDTLINGNTYKRIMRREYRLDGSKPLTKPVGSVVASYPDHTETFLREANQKVYWYRWDGQERRDTLIYDFTRIIGDTLPTVFNIYPGNYNFTYVIQAIDTVNINNTLRKRFVATHVDISQDTIIVIEGIGSSRGLIMNNKSGPYGFYNFTMDFHCFTMPGVEYNPKNMPCAYIWDNTTPTSVSSIPGDMEFTAYPNPFTNTVWIKAVSQGILTIYNASGNAVYRKHVMEGRNMIDAAALSNGLYYLVINDNSGRLPQGKYLVKQ